MFKKISTKLNDRLKEPSSYAGLAAILYGAGEIFKDDHLPVMAEAINTVGQTMTTTGSTHATIGALIMGIMALIVSEKKK